MQTSKTPNPVYVFRYINEETGTRFLVCPAISYDEAKKAAIKIKEEGDRVSFIKVYEPGSYDRPLNQACIEIFNALPAPMVWNESHSRRVGPVMVSGISLVELKTIFEVAQMKGQLEDPYQLVNHDPMFVYRVYPHSDYL